MNELCKAPDDILTIMGAVEPEEYAVRSNLRSFRNVASALIGQTESATARQLAWIVSDYVTEMLYVPADLALLRDLSQLCQNTLQCALAAERLEVPADA